MHQEARQRGTHGGAHEAQLLGGGVDGELPPHSVRLRHRLPDVVVPVRDRDVLWWQEGPSLLGSMSLPAGERRTRGSSCQQNRERALSGRILRQEERRTSATSQACSTSERVVGIDTRTALPPSTTCAKCDAHAGNQHP